MNYHFRLERQLLPAEQVPWSVIAKGSVANEADACIEEGGRCDAERGRLLHFVVLVWRLDGVLFRGAQVFTGCFSI